MTIQELADIIRKEEKKRDIRHEKTPANSKILKEKCGGTFEAVITGNGQEKCLIPQVGSLHFLYRGQNQEFVPCVPSLYRGNPSEAEIFIERMRLVVFQRLLNTHPVIKNFFNLKSATYWVSWDFACKTTKIHFIVHIPCITETSQTQNPLTP